VIVADTSSPVARPVSTMASQIEMSSALGDISARPSRMLNTGRQVAHDRLVVTQV
jgi:hypothetical protein